MSSGKHRHAPRHRGGHRKPSRTTKVTAYAGTTVAAGVIALGVGTPAAMASQPVPSSAAAIAQVTLQDQSAVIAAEHQFHLEHVAHEAHEAYLAWLAKQQTVTTTAAPVVQAPVQQDTPVQQPAQPAQTYQGSGSMQQCIISRESGGNAQVMNSTGHYGLYQFSASTWAAHGGNPADFGNASVAEQNTVYYNTVAADGYSDWAPYDGC